MRAGTTVVAAVVIGLAALVTACGSDGGSEVGGELHVYNWEDYFAPTTLQDFEAESGIRVFLDTFGDETELLSTIASDPSRYDVFIGTDALVGQMKGLRLVARLNLDNIPNLANIDPRFLDLPGDPGNQYSVPFDWGTTGVLYNETCIEPEEESWAVLRDPRVAGRVALDSDPTVVIGATLKSLGYSWFSSSEKEVAETTAVLREQVSTVRPMFLTATEARARMASGELCAAQAYNGDAAFAMAENEDLAFFVPKEGSDIWFDVMAIPRDAKNKAAAEIFLNYVLRPDVQAAINNYTGYPTPNRAAIELGYVDEESLANPVMYPDTDLLEPWIVLDSEAVALRNKAWAQVEAETVAR